MHILHMAQDYGKPDVRELLGYCPKEAQQEDFRLEKCALEIEQCRDQIRPYWTQVHKV